MEERFGRYYPDREALRGAVLGSSAGQRAIKLREAHREKVARNEVLTSPLWAQPCRAYNVHIELDPRTKASLGKTQQTLKQAEPNLLVCPQETLHVSLAWLLAVHVSYPVAKVSLWERYAEEWTTELNRIAAESLGFRITYEHVVATDSAVIALAEPTEPVNRIRRMIRERLRLPPETRNEADLVHTTLFRYGGPLYEPERFLAMLEDTSAEAASEVDELVISKELVFPSLEAEVLARLPRTPSGRSSQNSTSTHSGE
jgi:AcrR family transcriptional regulator